MKQKFTTHQLTATALMAAVLCVLAPLSLPVGPVPISLGTLAIYLAAYLLGARLSALSVLIYLVLGSVGLPVFAGYVGGLEKLVGPTGGYLIGFLFMALFAGLVIEKGGNRPAAAVLGMVLGTAVCYLCGTVWFVVVMQCDIWYALTACVFPFLLGDAAKIAVATLVGAVLRDRLQKAGLLKA
ncbi:MAG: biotin transporter BioY [Gemmiger sp.]|nr:biotin transporter BioY [Gemmiger sp.]